MIVLTIDYIHSSELIIAAVCLHYQHLSIEKSVSDLENTVLRNLSKEKSDSTDAVEGKTVASPPQNSSSFLNLPRRQGNSQASSNMLRELQARSDS